MEKGPFFSVVIPLFNKKPHIKRSIRSVLRQKYSDFELIVVDDGSTDEGLHELEEFSDDRLKSFRKSNGGVSSARNLGIEKSKSKYIAFLDADDEWEPLFLSNIYGMIQKYPRAGMYTASFTLIDRTNTRTKIVGNGLTELSSREYFRACRKRKATINNSSSTVVRRDLLLKACCFSETLDTYEDWNLWYKIALMSNVVSTSEVLVNIYRDAINRSDVDKPLTKYLLAYETLVCDIERFVQINDLELKEVTPVFCEKIQSLLKGGVVAKNWEFIVNLKKSELYKYSSFSQRILLSPLVFQALLGVYEVLVHLGIYGYRRRRK
ncbi:glycosyltransferase family 2 protein [Marinobacter oulmenensis]|uniref:Glycosyltransferase involved in cell wall biosynthesis n=1 Tax=Marinobacter oulmenensis TaxID=643747 RepID=A0A840UN60_9GAMM|nr:glycosyltransferase family A protein [Marinobacter oulmenensis]MBB5322516.1 glycosyltransferase involved in cell wall biosynthesis [Marinobacter oulmenensis]